VDPRPHERRRAAIHRLTRRADMPNAPISVERPGVAPPNDRKRRSYRALRFIPLAIAAMAMVIGLLTGLQRLGMLPLAETLSPAELHGALMISGFLGTVISLERAMAMGRWWAYGAPAASAAGALALAAGHGQAGALAFVLAGATLSVTTVFVAARQLATFVIALAIGAACWFMGSMLWLMGQSTPEVAGWWLNFLILTIAAERLELSRLSRVSHASQIAFFVAILLLVAGASASSCSKRRRHLPPPAWSDWLRGYCVTISPAGPYAWPVCRDFPRSRSWQAICGSALRACCWH
jgi:hypothetical protein